MNYEKYKSKIEELEKVMGKKLTAKEKSLIEKMVFDSFVEGENSVGMGLNMDGVFTPETPYLNKLFKEGVEDKTLAEKIVVGLDKSCIPKGHANLLAEIETQLSYNGFNPEELRKKITILEFEFGEASTAETPDLLNLAKKEGINNLAGISLSKAISNIGTTEYEDFKNEVLMSLPEPTAADHFHLVDRDGQNEIYDYFAEPAADSPLLPPFIDGLPTNHIKGDLTLLNAIRFGGKTKAMLCGVLCCLKRGEAVHVQSAEAMKETLWAELISMETGIPFIELIARQGLDDYKLNQMTVVLDLFKDKLTIDDSAVPSIVSVLYSCKKSLKLIKTERFFVDYMQLIKGRGKKLVEQLTDVAYSLKGFAKESKAHVIALCQLSREHGRRMGVSMYPNDSDIRDSDGIPQAADESIHIFLFNTYESYGYNKSALWEGNPNADGFFIYRKRRNIKMHRDPVPIVFNKNSKMEISYDEFNPIDTSRPSDNWMDDDDYMQNLRTDEPDF